MLSSQSIIELNRLYPSQFNDAYIESEELFWGQLNINIDKDDFGNLTLFLDYHGLAEPQDDTLKLIYNNNHNSYTIICRHPKEAIHEVSGDAQELLFDYELAPIVKNAKYFWDNGTYPPGRPDDYGGLIEDGYSVYYSVFDDSNSDFAPYSLMGRWSHYYESNYKYDTRIRTAKLVLKENLTGKPRELKFFLESSTDVWRSRVIVVQLPNK